MYQKDLVSVVMITYNHEKFIREAIEGVLMQQCNYPIELIIADDCLPDNTKVVVESFKSHPNYHWIKYTKHIENKGMMPNFMWAMEQAQCKYIALCEGDDYWTDPYKLQKQVDFLEANPEYVLCFHPVKVLQLDGQFIPDPIEERFLKITNFPIQKKDLLNIGNFIHTPSVVFRNVIHELPEMFQLSPVGDYLLYIILGDYGFFKRLNDEMAVYRKGVGIYSTLSNREMNLKILKYQTILLQMLSDPSEREIIANKSISIIDQMSRSLKNQIPIKNQTLTTILKSKIKRLIFWK